jgi:carboxyl-terminal processing protease
MPRYRPFREGPYRFTLAGLFALILLAMTAGIVVERQVLAALDPAAKAQLDYKLIAQADGLIEQHYVDRSAIRPRRMTYAAISGMVDSLGDTGHSVFLTPEMVREGKQELQGHFPGIGAEVRMRDKQVVIVAPLDGSPAQKAGLRAGDVIFKVDGRATAGETLEQVVRSIRGPAGTKVTLSVRDPGTDHTRSVEVVRAVIHPQRVSWHFVPGTRIADLRIATFGEGTAKSLRRAIRALGAAGANAVVLDLRDNPGGLLDQAIAVASEFLPGGNVLLEKDSRGKLEPEPVEAEKDRLRLPMVVLVNAGTASAAEIVSGALQDAGRAVVVGQKTFGTGTVLEEFGLPDGSALMLAVREWLTPDGHTIWHEGIQPNVKVALAADAAPVFPEQLAPLSPAQLAASRDAQLLKAIALLRARLPSSLSAGLAARRRVALLGQATFFARSPSSPAATSACRMRSISAAGSLASGGRTTARGSLPSSTSASFMRLCMSTQGSP